MSLNIEKDDRNTGKYFHKHPGITSTKEIRRQAIRDIGEECGDGEFFSSCYINRESSVLIACQNNPENIVINTCVL